MISREQTRIVEQAKEKLALSSEEFKEMLIVYGGAKNVRDLTPEGFFHLMERFREMGFMTKGALVRREAPQEPGEVIEMVTPALRERIRQLEMELGWSDTPSKLESFILQNLNIKRVVTKEQAFKVIEALKAILESENDLPTGTK